MGHDWLRNRFGGISGSGGEGGRIPILYEGRNKKQLEYPFRIRVLQEFCAILKGVVHGEAIQIHPTV